MTKIFIYNGANTGENSRQDARQLFECEDIFNKRPDVVLSDFNENFSGLNPIQDNPTLVIPGGAAIFMGIDMLESGQKAKIQDLISQGFHFVGICAGAYLATTNSDIFNTRHVYHSIENTFSDPEFQMSSRIEQFSFNICSSHSALGPFYPNKDYDDYPNKTELKLKNLLPFNVTLSLNETSQKISQLFVGGCGFESQAIPDRIDKKLPYEIVATYADRENYSFSYSDLEQKKTIHNFAAMIRKKAGSQPKDGGVFLSGTHIEACVKDSKLLNYFHLVNERGKMKLTENQYNSLLEAQNSAKEHAVHLLKSTFQRRGQA